LPIWFLDTHLDHRNHELSHVRSHYQFHQNLNTSKFKEEAYKKGPSTHRSAITETVQQCFEKWVKLKIKDQTRSTDQLDLTKTTRYQKKHDHFFQI
jgi:hypothetical protein